MIVDVSHIASRCFTFLNQSCCTRLHSCCCCCCCRSSWKPLIILLPYPKCVDVWFLLNTGTIPEPPLFFLNPPPKALHETIPIQSHPGVSRHGIQLNGTITALEVWMIGRPKFHWTCAHIGRIGTPSWENCWCKMFLFVGVWDFLCCTEGFTGATKSLGLFNGRGLERYVLKLLFLQALDDSGKVCCDVVTSGSSPKR